MNKSYPSPWDFTQPEYDRRSSIFMNAGTNRGIGIKQPVGKEKPSGKFAVPQYYSCRDPREV